MSGPTREEVEKLVPELDQIEEALTDSVRAFEASGMNPKMQNRALWSFMRLRAALLSGSRSGEDARDAARWRKHMEAMRDEMSCLLIRMFEGTAEDYEAAIDAAMGAPDA